MSLGEKLRGLREDQNWSQEYVGRKLNISRTTISKFENNKQTPSLDTLIEYAKLFHIDENYLLEEVTHAKSNEKKAPYHTRVDEGDRDTQLLIELIQKNPKLKKSLLKLDQSPIKEQQKAIDAFEILINGLKKK